MTEFRNVIELLDRGDIEAAATEFSNAVYTRAKKLNTEELEREPENEPKAT